jgi:hypothetical protein
MDSKKKFREGNLFTADISGKALSLSGKVSGKIDSPARALFTRRRVVYGSRKCSQQLPEIEYALR